MTTLLLSDLHLAANRPYLRQRFAAFCATAAKNAHAIYILGDLFDVWLGDDQLDHDESAAEVARFIKSVTDENHKVYIQHGNRDFLLGHAFARATGATFIDDPFALDLYGVSTVLTHGDLLCTDDIHYLALRQKWRAPCRLKMLSHLPYFIRARVAKMLRRQSVSEKTRKPAYVMDVKDNAVADMARRFHATRLIHGHTHKPDTHHLMMDGKKLTRVVLPDWREEDRETRYLEITENTFSFKTL